jgi:hypothetical protein
MPFDPEQPAIPLKPDEDQATQFCIMLRAGLPAEEAILYFLPPDADKAQAMDVVSRWQRCRAVKKAMLKLLGKGWHEMSLDEKIHAALEQHYAALAYLLFSTNYISAGTSEKTKIDTARTALEQKLAGMAGQGDALSRFLDDLRTGRIQPVKAPVALPAIAVPPAH